ncbi:response regulator transcription factor [Sphingomonas cannabina]|uniref:response regulator transcription factor n=1 Tax=Sphingomonas cannabina TaxID=2899123 RepID=UPI001F1F646D|nr:response regulator transcription factor [Sphingomonas cannabina]UIJ45520.1 response regulator transcription factor [Sphingomonas cannabina]
MRIIVLEEGAGSDEPLHKRLRREGFEAEGAGSALEFYRSMAMDSYDIVVIDAGPSDQVGLEIASWLRRKGGVGIILLTVGNRPQDRIGAFESGVDLHLAKPVAGDELVHGVHSLARRIVRGEMRVPAPVTAEPRWFFDPVHWTLQAPNRRLVKLTAVETRFVQRLLIQSGAVIARAELRAELGYGTDQAGDKNLDAVIRRLRRKIEKATGDPAPIQTVHGRGYLFSAPIRLERRRTPAR